MNEAEKKYIPYLAKSKQNHASTTIIKCKDCKRQGKPWEFRESMFSSKWYCPQCGSINLEKITGDKKISTTKKSYKVLVPQTTQTSHSRKENQAKNTSHYVVENHRSKTSHSLVETHNSKTIKEETKKEKEHVQTSLF